jgi:hypothetical protein
MHPPANRQAYLQRAAQLRAQAAEAREVADLILEDDICCRMLNVAEDWERKAAEAALQNRDAAVGTRRRRAA